MDTDVIEPAKSGRAACRTCRKKIDKGALRFGEAMESQFDPDGGVSLAWHHMLCAAERMPEKLKPALDAYAGDVPDRAAIEAAIASPKKGKGASKTTFPRAEKAPSGRARCIECEVTIAKGEWRVAVEREIDTGTFVTTGAGYLHPKCVGAHVGDIWDVVFERSGLTDQEAAEVRAAIG